MKKIPSSNLSPRSGFTMVELMVVIIIIGILTAISVPVVAHMKHLADVTVCVNNMKQVANATMLWATNHGDKLPSPQYSGDEVDRPLYWKLDTDGQEGLWLNGVVYAQIYIEANLADSPDDIVAPPTGGSRATAGAHLVDTVFENRVSTLEFPEELDWYKHSFAMNANLEYDELAELRNLQDPYLSEKTVSKFDPAGAMLYIDCMDSNIVRASDYEMIIDAAEKRYDGSRILVAYMDGRVQKLRPEEIPNGDINSDRESSRFWRGVMPDR